MNNIKTELWKATHSRMFILAIAAGCLISLLDVLQTALVTRRILESTQTLLSMNLPISSNPAGSSLFLKWISVNGVNWGSRTFSLIWPILAAMPYGFSLCQDRRSGYDNQTITRCGEKPFFRGKYIACFVTGGLAVSLPVILNLLLDALICPAWTPEVQMLGSSIGNGYFLAKLFYTKPWIFCAVWCVLDFLWGGAVACLCLTLGGVLRHSFMVVLFPFVVLFAAESVISALGSFFQYSVELSPLVLVLAAPGRPNPWWVILGEILVLLAVSAGAGYWQVKKHELP